VDGFRRRHRDVRFWLRLSKKPRHIGGVKLWNQGGADFDSFLPQPAIKRINLSVSSGGNTFSTASASSRHSHQAIMQSRNH
jgi:hypothetical protein